MEFAYSPKVEEYRGRLTAFMDEHVYPSEPVYAEQVAKLADPWDRPPVIDQLKAEARSRGLWNLFLPHAEFGAGLGNLEYAPLAEITGRSPAPNSAWGRNRFHSPRERASALSCSITGGRSHGSACLATCSA